MIWQQLRIRTSESEVQALEALCNEHGAVAITFEDAGDTPVLEPAPGEMPLWSALTLTALFDATTDLDPLNDALAEHGVGAAAIHREAVPDRNWENEWLRDFKARNVGRHLRIIASHQDEPDDERHRVVLDPGLAFGTGSHPTTLLVLEWLQSLPLTGRNVLDMGCGSGILAIAALKLGARAAVGVDIDPQAIDATRRNAGVNGVAGRLTAQLPDALAPGEYDIVVANILANTLIAMAPELAARTRSGGALAMTGILPGQAADLVARYADAFDMAPPRHHQGWVLLAGVRR